MNDRLKNTKKFLNELFVKDPKNDQEMVRLAIIAEYDAINLYKRFAEQSTDPRVKDIMNHLVEDESEHVGELEELLGTIDPNFEEEKEEGEEEASEVMGEPRFLTINLLKNIANRNDY